MKIFSTTTSTTTKLVKDYITRFGKSALIKAACRGQLELCTRLLARCDVNFSDKKGVTALMYAALNGDESICRLLINGHAEVNRQCEDGWTSLMYAASKDNQQVCRLLIQNGAHVDMKSAERLTALTIAAQLQHVGTCRVLVAAGADVNARKDGTSVLMRAIERGQSELVDVLVGGGVMKRGVDDGGRSVETMTENCWNKTISHNKCCEHAELEDTRQDVVEEHDLSTKERNGMEIREMGQFVVVDKIDGDIEVVRTQAVRKLYWFKCKLNGQLFYALLDCGATLCCIARRCVTSNPVLSNMPVTAYTGRPLLDANKNPLSAKEEITLFFVAGVPALRLKVSMVIVDDLPYSCIIGTNLLSKLKNWGIDNGNSILFLNSSAVSLWSAPH